MSCSLTMQLLYLCVLVQMSGPGKWSLLSPEKESGRVGTVSYILITLFSGIEVWVPVLPSVCVDLLSLQSL